MSKQTNTTFKPLCAQLFARILNYTVVIETEPRHLGIRNVHFHYTAKGLNSLSGRTTNRKISRPWDSGLDLTIALKPERHLSSSATACKISERYDHYNMQSRGFETSRDLAVRRLTSYWIEVQMALNYAAAWYQWNDGQVFTGLH